MQNLTSKPERPKKERRKRPISLEPKIVLERNNKLHADGTERISTESK